MGCSSGEQGSVSVPFWRVTVSAKIRKQAVLLQACFCLWISHQSSATYFGTWRDKVFGFLLPLEGSSVSCNRIANLLNVAVALHLLGMVSLSSRIWWGEYSWLLLHKNTRSGSTRKQSIYYVPIMTNSTEVTNLLKYVQFCLQI